MTCYKPLHGFFSKKRNTNGKRDIVFNKKDGYLDMPVEIPCGRCTGCRLETSRQWAVRCVHEAQLHEENSFITLTYNDDHLPQDLSLRKQDVQKFLKRLRRKYPHKNIRYLYCGEYGENNKRPHYHLCLFGVDFHADREFYKRNTLEQNLYTSPTLDKLWSKPLKKGEKPSPIGYAIIGDLTFQSSAYVARYVTKKINGENQEAHYGTKVDTTTGELSLALIPEFAESSRRPALGKLWFYKHYKEVYPNDFVVVDKKPQKPPKYYDNLLEKLDNDLYSKVKYKRLNSMKNQTEKQLDERDPYRLATKEKIRSRKKQRLPRSIE